MSFYSKLSIAVPLARSCLWLDHWIHHFKDIISGKWTW